MANQSTSRSRCWIWVLNNYTPEEEGALPCHDLEALGIRYICYGREEGELGTPHLQGFIQFSTLKSMDQVKFVLASQRVHLERKSRYSTFAQCIEYCEKDGEFWEWGDRPMDPVDKGDCEKRRWIKAYEAATKGTFDDIDKDILIRCYGSIKRIRNDAAASARKPDTEEQMLWYYGAAGTGKSRKAREDHPDAYLKACNKWWDGYMPGSRSAVIIEDFDKRHEVLIHHLKIWADRYDFMAETKGSSMLIRPSLIIVTSNYHPSEIWTEENDLGPILRRFKIVRFDNI